MAERARLIGINHVALEVGDLEAALDLYGRVPGMAFLDMGDQFLAVAETGAAGADGERHFGLVVDDIETAREAIAREGLEILPGRGLDFRDPWGNHIPIVDYRRIQFERAPGVRRALGIEWTEKTPEALREIAEKGLA